MSNFEYSLSLTATDDDRDEQELRLDHSKIEFSAAGWQLGFGQVARRCRPSRHTSLILGINAHPLPSLYGALEHEKKSQNTWLSWLGPWRLDTFLGDMGGARDVNNPLLFGARFEASPTVNLSIGLNFTGQFGGEGYENGFGAFWDMLFEVSYDLPEGLCLCDFT